MGAAGQEAAHCAGLGGVPAQDPAEGLGGYGNVLLGRSVGCAVVVDEHASCRLSLSSFDDLGVGLSVGGEARARVTDLTLTDVEAAFMVDAPAPLAQLFAVGISLSLSLSLSSAVSAAAGSLAAHDARGGDGANARHVDGMVGGDAGWGEGRERLDWRVSDGGRYWLTEERPGLVFEDDYGPEVAQPNRDEHARALQRAVDGLTEVRLPASARPNVEAMCAEALAAGNAESAASIRGFLEAVRWDIYSAEEEERLRPPELLEYHRAVENYTQGVMQLHANDFNLEPPVPYTLFLPTFGDPLPIATHPLLIPTHPRLIPTHRLLFPSHPHSSLAHPVLIPAHPRPSLLIPAHPH